MRLSTFSDYSLRVLMYLAQQGDRLATIEEIASAYGISRSHLMKVVHQLALGGTVETVRGKGGGLRLALDPAQIRLGQVLRQTEGEGPIVECLSGEPARCRITPVCKLPALLTRAFDALYAELDRHTLADLVTRPAAFQRVLVQRQP